MTDDDRAFGETDWQGMVLQAVERLAGRKPFVFNKDLGPSCTLRRAVMIVFNLSGAGADELCKMFDFDPLRRVRKPT